MDMIIGESPRLQVTKKFKILLTSITDKKNSNAHEGTSPRDEMRQAARAMLTDGPNLPLIAWRDRQGHISF